MELLERGAQLATLREQFAKIDDSAVSCSSRVRPAPASRRWSRRSSPTRDRRRRCSSAVRRPVRAPPVGAPGRHRQATTRPAPRRARRSRSVGGVRGVPLRAGRAATGDRRARRPPVGRRGDARSPALRSPAARTVSLSRDRDVSRPARRQQPAPANARVVRRARRHPHRAGTALGRVRANARG